MGRMDFNSMEGRVGINLEETGDIAMDDLQSQFTAAEWTAKESLIKADGRGLQIPLDTLEVGGQPSVLVNGQHWYIRDLPIFQHYACHIACEHPIGQVTTEEIGPDKF